jgi:hypothetical protein
MADARTRLTHAGQYLAVAELAFSPEGGPETTVATGNAVLSGMAAADAICCALAGRRHRGAGHREAAEFLGTVTGDRDLARFLRELIDLKDAAHYGLENVKAQGAKAAIRRARSLVAAARDRVK